MQPYPQHIAPDLIHANAAFHFYEDQTTTEMVYINLG